MLRRFAPSILFICIATLGPVLIGRAEEKSLLGDWPAIREQTFVLVWETVNEAYFDPTFGGVDWNAVGRKHRGLLAGISDREHLLPLLGAMLSELGRSHFAIVPRQAVVFQPVERSRVGTIGASFVATDRGIVTARVEPKSPADEAGVLSGDVVVSLQGEDLEKLAHEIDATSITGHQTAQILLSWVKGQTSQAVGQMLRLTVCRGDGERRALTLRTAACEGAWSEPVGGFPSLPIECETRRGDDGIGYLRITAFAPAIMKQVKTFLRSLQPSDGLVIDLRGNPGGLGMMAPGISGWLTDHEFSLGSMHLREGRMEFEIFPQKGAFLGPVAILIDGSSASTSEILAGGLQEAKRARIFGERSAGAALPSAFRELPTGDLFQYAIADVKTPSGKAIEGHGINPDEAVKRGVEDLAAGRDPVLDAARVWLASARNSAGSAGGGGSQ